MKNYFLTLLFALVALTACNDTEEYYYKTPGEITGEKITELLETGSRMSQCRISAFFNDVRKFTIEGQFLHVYGNNNNQNLTFDLNQLHVWSYVEMPYTNESYFSFNFNMNK